jgi:phage-related protein
MAGRQIRVEVIGDARSLEAALGKAQQKTSKFGHALGVATKVAGGALLGLGATAKIGFDELRDSQNVAAQTAAVIKSTGGAANVTSKQVTTLAQSLLHKSGVDDETIASGENLLLTFRNIRNETGKGNDIFNQATKATLDLSVAMGKDMKSSALVVGKALNDPVKGITALRRVGVQFSSAQEDVIKHLAETGHQAKAQKMILAELTKEFGGSAQAAGTTLTGQLGKLRESFADVAANLVQALLPAFTDLVGVLSDATSWMKQNETATRIIVGTIAALSAGVLVVNGVYKAWAAITKVAAAAQWLLNAALSANPIYAIIQLVVLLGIALVVAYKKSETFRNIVNGAFNAVRHAAGAVAGVLRGPLSAAFGVIRSVAGRAIDFIRDHWKIIVAVIGGPVVAAISLVATHLHTVRNVAGSVLGFMGDKWQSVIGPIKRVWGWIQNVIDKVSSLVGWIGRIDWPSPPSWLGDLAGKIPGIATGTTSARGGLALVGERGPELVNMPRGSRVWPAGETRNMLGGGGAAQPLIVHNHIILDGREIGVSVQRFDGDYRRRHGGRGAFEPVGRR